MVHEHRHPEALGRSPLAALGIGLVHGAGGSAGAGSCSWERCPTRCRPPWRLVVFAIATAASMALASSGFGLALARRAVTRRLRTALPAFGALSLLFGVWYALGALETLPYPL